MKEKKLVLVRMDWDQWERVEAAAKASPRRSVNAWIREAMDRMLVRGLEKATGTLETAVGSGGVKSKPTPPAEKDVAELAKGIVQGQFDRAIKLEPSLAETLTKPETYGKCGKCGCPPKRKRDGCRVICFCPAHTEAT